MLRFRSKLGLSCKFNVSLHQGISFVVQDFWGLRCRVETTYENFSNFTHSMQNESLELNLLNSTKLDNFKLAK